MTLHLLRSYCPGHKGHGEKNGKEYLNKIAILNYILFNMRPTKTTATILSACILLQVSAQEKQDKLFADSKPLDIALKVSIEQVKDNTGDTLYEAHLLKYRNSNGTFDSVSTNMRVRGKFRLAECYFPPLSLKFKKEDIKGTLLEGNKSLKLVMPCKTNSQSNDLIVREFLCYKLYEIITPYCFRTRLVHLDFTEEQRRKEKNFQLKGILIEDADKAAKRFNGKILGNITATPNVLQDTADLVVSLFQYLISNTDWSSMYQHNIKLMQRGPKDLIIPITYDFDMAGMVDAGYAIVSETGGGDAIGEQNSVKDRLYRGWCRPDNVTQYVRQDFISKEEKLLAAVDGLKDELPEKQIQSVKTYIGQFFKILKDDNSFKRLITSQCRKN
jgi:hypothetical protein